MKDYQPGSDEFAVQTALAHSLPHATHPMFDNWRDKADALVEQMEKFGYEIRPIAGREQWGRT